MINKQTLDIAKYDDYSKYATDIAAKGGRPVTKEEWDRIKSNQANMTKEEYASAVASTGARPTVEDMEKVEEVNKVEPPVVEEEPEKKLTFEDFMNAVNSGADPEEWLKQHPNYIPGDKTNAWLADYRANKKMNDVEAKAETPAETTTDSVDTPKEAEETIEEANKSKEGWTKFWNAWKSGQFNMYPTMKAVADSIAKNAQMNIDRANILTGKGSDASIYTPIETEQDKIRESQLETRAKTGTDLPTAFNKAENGDYEDLGRMIASGEITYENAYMGLSGSAKEKFENWYKNAETRDNAETEKAKADVKAAAIANRTTVQSNINQLEARKTELQSMVNQLSGNEANWNAYATAMNSYMGTVRGLEDIGVVTTDSKTKEKSYTGSLNQKVGASIKMVKADISQNNTWTNGSTEANSNSNTLSKDAQALARLPDAEKYASASFEERKNANDDLIAKLNETIKGLDEAIAGWRNLLSEGGAKA